MWSLGIFEPLPCTLQLIWAASYSAESAGAFVVQPCRHYSPTGVVVRFTAPAILHDHRRSMRMPTTHRLVVLGALRAPTPYFARPPNWHLVLLPSQQCDLDPFFRQPSPVEQSPGVNLQQEAGCSAVEPAAGPVGRSRPRQHSTSQYHHQRHPHHTHPLQQQHTTTGTGETRARGGSVDAD